MHEFEIGVVYTKDTIDVDSPGWLERAIATASAIHYELCFINQTFLQVQRGNFDIVIQHYCSLDLNERSKTNLWQRFCRQSLSTSNDVFENGMRKFETSDDVTPVVDIKRFFLGVSGISDNNSAYCSFRNWPPSIQAVVAASTKTIGKKLGPFIHHFHLCKNLQRNILSSFVQLLCKQDRVRIKERVNAPVLGFGGGRRPP